jgi:thiamine-monophosphate kinase
MSDKTAMRMAIPTSVWCRPRLIVHDQAELLAYDTIWRRLSNDTSMSTKRPSGHNLRVGDVGEFGLIERLQAHIDDRYCPRGASPLEPGIGDDAAVWQPSDGSRQVVTTDALVEDVHFKLSTTSWRDLGWKSLAVNVSDLAAMGAAPRCALVTLGLGSDIALSDVLDLYDGMLDLAAELSLSIAGGDIVSSPLVLISITAIGEASGNLLRRDAGQPGDSLAVTGSLGASFGGLRLLKNSPRVREGSGSVAANRLLQAHLRPRPRVMEGRLLVEAGLRCGLDVSDGLLGDATRICERSGVGAEIDISLVPVDSALEAEYHQEALEMAISGGEDYELLCGGPPGKMEQATTALAELGTPLTVIGQLTERPSSEPLVRFIDASGQRVQLRSRSWDHFDG